MYVVHAPGRAQRTVAVPQSVLRYILLFKKQDGITSGRKWCMIIGMKLFLNEVVSWAGLIYR